MASKFFRISSKILLCVFFNSFIKGSLNYHPLKWMFLTVTINQQINELHIIRFMIIYKVETWLSKDVLAWAYDFLIRMKR